MIIKTSLDFDNFVNEASKIIRQVYSNKNQTESISEYKDEIKYFDNSKVLNWDWKTKSTNVIIIPLFGWYLNRAKDNDNIERIENYIDPLVYRQGGYNGIVLADITTTRNLAFYNKIEVIKKFNEVEVFEDDGFFNPFIPSSLSNNNVKISVLERKLSHLESFNNIKRVFL